jgi:hypothetical protein
MNVVTGYPPNIDAIDAVFNVRNKPGLLYCYGDTIYVPDGTPLTPELKAHEGVHYVRQTATSPEKWWNLYLTSPEFRLAEELPAHRAEYKQFCALNRDRNARSRALHAIAARLAGPLYLGLISFSKARQFIAGCR